MKLLFIAWDGVGDHYMRGLFLPIMNGLRQKGFDVHILHLSSMPRNKLEALQELSRQLELSYHHVQIKRSARGFVEAVFSGRSWLKRYKKKHKNGMVMPRSLMPALLVRLAGLGGHTLIYDADGLALDERLDFAGWQESSLKFRFFKGIENWVMIKSHRVLVRTEKAKEVLLKRYPHLSKRQIRVVINGKNELLFAPLNETVRQKLRMELEVGKEDILVVYCGTLAPQYCLDEMLSWFAHLSENKVANTKLMVITGQQEMIQAHDRYNQLQDQIILKTVAAEEVPRLLGSADIALALRKASFSMRGVSPIKIGEYLMCGLPVIASKGIGDTEAILAPLSSSQLIDESDPDQLLNSVSVYLESIRSMSEVPLSESVEQGRKHYSMEKAIDSYLQVLHE